MLCHEISLRIADRSERISFKPLLRTEHAVGLREYFQIAFRRLRGRDAACVGDLAPHAEELGPTINEMAADRRDHHHP